MCCINVLYYLLQYTEPAYTPSKAIFMTYKAHGEMHQSDHEKKTHSHLQTPCLDVRPIQAFDLESYLA